MKNLLPQQDKIILKSGYKRRFLVVSSVMIFFAFIISSIVFIPLFVTSMTRLGDVNKKIEVNSVAIKDQSDTLLLPNQINLKVNAVLSFKNISLVSKRLSTIAGAKSSGISLSSLSYQKSTKTPIQIVMLLSGIAKDRQSLLSFEDSLKEIDFIKNISVPVGSFTKDNNLPFTITIDISPT